MGVTGYFGMPFWRVPQLQLDFQEYAKYPFGGPWGVIGIDGRVTAGILALPATLIGVAAVWIFMNRRS